MAVGVSVLGADTKNSTRSAIGWPVHWARSASLGPKPARQKRRSTIAWRQRRRRRRRGGGAAAAGAIGALTAAAGVVMNRIRVRWLWRSPSIVRTA